MVEVNAVTAQKCVLICSNLVDHVNVYTVATVQRLERVDGFGRNAESLLRGSASLRVFTKAWCLTFLCI